MGDGVAVDASRPLVSQGSGWKMGSFSSGSAGLCGGVGSSLWMDRKL